jgi:hypothetical protein
MNILPDSRVKNPTGTVMAEWEFEQVERIAVAPFFHVVRRKHRMEMEKIFCPECGKQKGWIPSGIFSWVCFLCDACAAEKGEKYAECKTPDHEFWAAVGNEMQARFGRALSEQELNQLAERAELGRLLELLNRESPLRGK